jgi:hypothetical protein
LTSARSAGHSCVPFAPIFTELGWLQHKVSHDAEVGPALDFAMRQFCLNVGFVFRN